MKFEKLKKSGFIITLFLILIWIAAYIMSKHKIDIGRSAFWYLCSVFGIENTFQFDFLHWILTKFAKTSSHFIYIIGRAVGEEAVFRGFLFIFLCYQPKKMDTWARVGVVLYAIFSSILFSVYMNFQFWGEHSIHFFAGLFLCWVVYASWKNYDLEKLNSTPLSWMEKQSVLVLKILLPAVVVNIIYNFLMIFIK